MKHINSLCFALFLLFIGLNPIKSISVNKMVQVSYNRVRIVNSQSGFCVSYDDRRNNYVFDANSLCDQLEPRVHWALEPSKDGGFFFRNLEYNKYLRPSGDRKGTIGDKFSLKLDYLNDKLFRIYFMENNIKYCYDPTTRESDFTFRECNQKNENYLGFTYQFDVSPFSPLIETDVYYLFFWFDGSNKRGFRPQYNSLKRSDGVYNEEASPYDVSNHWKFVPHPFQIGVYQIVNKEGWAIQTTFEKYGTSWYGSFNIVPSNINNENQYFRLIRSPFAQNYFYIRSNFNSYYCLIKGNGVIESHVYEFSQYYYSVEKICDTPTVREDVWYQVKSDSRCLTHNPNSAHQVKYEDCKLNDDFFWKFNWDSRLNAYKITHKLSGKIMTVDDRFNAQVHLVDGDPKSLNARWVPTEHDNIFPLMFRFINRLHPYCFGNSFGGCKGTALHELVQPVFKLLNEDVIGNGYNDVCGWDNKSPFYLNSGLV